MNDMEKDERIVMSIERQHAAQRSCNTSQPLICASNSAHKLSLEANFHWIKHKASGLTKWRYGLLHGHAGSDIVWGVPNERRLPVCLKLAVSSLFSPPSGSQLQGRIRHPK
jgi:hypothetical protein